MNNCSVLRFSITLYYDLSNIDSPEGTPEHARSLRLKESDPHKAVVIGDTIGDPLKGTSWPSLNILVKLMTVESLVFAPFFVTYSGIIFKYLKLRGPWKNTHNSEDSTSRNTESENWFIEGRKRWSQVEEEEKKRQTMKRARNKTP